MKSPLHNAFVVAILHKLCMLLGTPLHICTSKEKNLLKLTFVLLSLFVKIVSTYEVYSLVSKSFLKFYDSIETLIKGSMINRNSDSHVANPKLITNPLGLQAATLKFTTSLSRSHINKSRDFMI